MVGSSVVVVVVLVDVVVGLLVGPGLEEMWIDLLPHISFWIESNRPSNVMPKWLGLICGGNVNCLVASSSISSWDQSDLPMNVLLTWACSWCLEYLASGSGILNPSKGLFKTDRTRSASKKFWIILPVMVAVLTQCQENRCTPEKTKIFKGSRHKYPGYFTVRLTVRVDPRAEKSKSLIRWKRRKGGKRRKRRIWLCN